jgi:hypothetical protein
MLKALTASCIAVASIALFLPAAAGAANKPHLTDPQGAVKAGSTVWLTNIGDILFTSTGKATIATCTTAHLTGTVLRNDSGFVEVMVTKANLSGTGPLNLHNGLQECTGSSGSLYATLRLPLCIRSTPAHLTHEFEIGTGSGSKCSEGVSDLRFILGSTSIGECEYDSTTRVRADVTTGEKSPLELTVRNTQAGSGATEVNGNIFCPSSAMLAMKFSMETDTASGSFLDPIWITKLP